MNDQALYLESDEDITSAIDKLRRAEAPRVQIVTPKRSILLQSVINLKLLKKAADDAGREIVLVTNDPVVKGLAARLELAVASSVGAKASVAPPPPPPPLQTEDVIEEGDDEVEEGEETPAGATEPAAAGAGMSSRLAALKPGKPAASAPVVTRRTIGDEAPEEKAAQPKVPNFGRLQRRLLWAGAALTLVLGYFAAMHFLTSATLTLYARGAEAEVDTEFTVDPASEESNAGEGLLKGQRVSYDHDLTSNFAATGKKEVGTKASGEMTISNSMGVEQTLIAGTRFSSPDGKIFRSDAEVVVPAARLNADGDKVNGQASVKVTADQPGDGYNQAPAPYGIPALGNDRIRAQGGQMSGGTSKTVPVVTQADIDKAREALLKKDAESALKELRGQIGKGSRLLEASISQTAARVAAEPAAGEEATGQPSLTVTASYTALAVPEKDLADLLRTQGELALGDNKQIYEDGLEGAKIAAKGEADAAGRQTFSLVAVVSGGPKIDTATVAREAKGKKYGEAIELAGGLPGIERAEVSMNPSWASRLPRLERNIKVELTVAGKE